MRLIGLTGGISTGKSSVANYLATQYHLPILDADIYAREAVQPGSLILQKIQERYGDAVLLSDGSLDRAYLGNIIFSDVNERRWLEGLIHPDVRTRLSVAIQDLMSQTVRPTAAVLVIPLLFEANMTDLVTEIWVVWCDLDQQIERLRKRDRISIEQARSRIDSQLPLALKCFQADVVLDNSKTIESLQQQIDVLLLNCSQNF